MKNSIIVATTALELIALFLILYWFLKALILGKKWKSRICRDDRVKTATAVCITYFILGIVYIFLGKERAAGSSLFASLLWTMIRVF